MSAPRVVYAASPDASPERERTALAAAFRVLFEETEVEQAAAPHGDGEDGKRDQEVPADGSIRRSS